MHIYTPPKKWDELDRFCLAKLLCLRSRDAEADLHRPKADD